MIINDKSLEWHEKAAVDPAVSSLKSRAWLVADEVAGWKVQNVGFLHKKLVVSK